MSAAFFSHVAGREAPRPGYLIRRKAVGTEFKQLRKVIDDNEELSEFVHDKIRFVGTLILKILSFTSRISGSTV